jgi:adenine deaminase
MNTRIQGNLVDIHSETIYPVEISISGGVIKDISRIESARNGYIIPGFVDAHIHIESSLLLPVNFSRIALSHGTVATVSDPHEIANVCGLEGVNFMIENGKKAEIKFFWTAPSCVPATIFETAGAILTAADIQSLFSNPQVVALGEMMNYPGVIYGDEMVLNKCKVALLNNRLIDGHAPGVSGDDLKKYVSAGITTDHECSSLDEALEKINLGMKILIREGSSAKNFASLQSLLRSHPDRVMLCSDDLHADDLISGHLNLLVKRAVGFGIPIFNVLKAVSLNPVQHYKLPVGLLRIGDSADFNRVDNLQDFTILETWVDGNSSKDADTKAYVNQNYPNKFNTSDISSKDLLFSLSGGAKGMVISVEEGSIVTSKLEITLENGLENAIQKNQLLKLYVKDRYSDQTISKGLVKGFGIMKGALASTIAHDSHNIIAIGRDEQEIAEAINLVIKNKGGISFVGNGEKVILPLPVAGLMSDKNAYFVAGHYEKIIRFAINGGCILKSPLMTLSFLALLVIPSLKLSDKGLFDSDTFTFTDLFY